MKEAIVEYRFNTATLPLINAAESITDEYLNKGYVLTVRQLYYQFVARDIFANKESNYHKLVNIVNKGRLAGIIDWDAICDRTRHLRALSCWSSPAARVESAACTYNEDKWDDQECYVEVWVEKDALIDVIERAADKYDVPSFSCRGYVSLSAIKEAADRLHGHMALQEVIILHLGDHDPSGIDMTRDIRERLELFGVQFTIQRIALNMNQVKQYNPPPAPAKVADARYQKYVSKYGSNVWELDALEPAVMEQLIVDNILCYLQEDVWNDSINRQEANRKKIEKAATQLRKARK